MTVVYRELYSRLFSITIMITESLSWMISSVKLKSTLGLTLLRLVGAGWWLTCPGFAAMGRCSQDRLW